MSIPLTNSTALDKSIAFTSLRALCPFFCMHVICTFMYVYVPLFLPIRLISLSGNDLFLLSRSQSCKCRRSRDSRERVLSRASRRWLLLQKNRRRGPEEEKRDIMSRCETTYTRNYRKPLRRIVTFNRCPTRNARIAFGMYLP
jgi:hypothetical protein